VEVEGASTWLAALSAKRSSWYRELILPDKHIDCLIQRSGTNVGCLAHSGEKAGCASTGNEASFECYAAERGILEVVEAVEEALAALVALVDSHGYHAATAVPGHKLTLLVPATRNPTFGFGDREKDCSRQHLEVSAAMAV
jgi:hypothetical protein